MLFGFCFRHGGLASVLRFTLNQTFYRGKTITFVVGVSPGGAYDVWARLIASHMSKHIPGNPQIIVQNMPGAGGTRCS